MIRCLAVDDEAYASEILAGYIRKTPGLELVSTTTNPFDAIQLVQSGEVDLVFLDIQMPELNGIQFLKICGRSCKVILTTAYEQYALEGFEHDVVDYLMKPIPYDRFYRSIMKAKQLFEGDTPKLKNEPEHANGTAFATDYIFLKGDSKNKFIKVDLKDIIYIEGLKNYISVYTSTQRLITYQSLRDFEAQLPPTEFIRVHKSYIIPFGKISTVDGNSLFINNQLIPIGDAFKEAFFKAIKERRS
ncbi:LytR/AlgR family response regulator transcription factor [Pedobacter sp. SAFR-022]|uniref:LytR/AlgR family response regulator transcription factor n=1 Tax=Pedobacter sp. SAFR-022 TaxID=3436861 RepID=UPI003F7E759B